jgi:arginyl-tRNA synthetase
MLLYYSCLIKNCATKYQVNTITTYLYNLASAFHNYYETNTIVDFANKHTAMVSKQRIMLCRAVKQVLANGLTILGITPMEKMDREKPAPAIDNTKVVEETKKVKK